MNTFTSEIAGRNAAHIGAIKAALGTVEDLHWNVTRSLRGTYVLFLTCECTASELSHMLNDAFRGLGVRVRLKKSQMAVPTALS